MDYRGVLIVALIGAGGAGLLSATSCSGPDPGSITFADPRPTVSIGTSGTSGTGTSGGTDAGSSGGDAGSEGGVVGDPVFGTTTFAAGSPGRGAPARAANPAHGGDSSGKDCIVAGCHLGGWAFGGTLYNDAAGTARVAGAEIRVTGPDGKEYAKTYSDADGNFWIDALPTPLPAGSRVGVRNATLKRNMAGTIGAGQAGCNQAGTCHGTGGTQGKVFLN
ncbi:MAG: carboxypeptidase regulatory-like domain-containing protein [Deltaproteobacteria bacterium]|nr:carboxypeptidase regulatory-like domain-containing protein [Deltaproteobacteria bacterium]